MKKYLLALVLGAGSQLGHAQTVHLGLKAGVNFSRFVGPNTPNDINSRFGVNAGVLADIGFGTHWAIQPEVLYTSKGSKQVGGTGATSLQQYLGYLDVPLLLKYKTHHVFVEAGPQLGVLFGATSTFESNMGTMETNNKELFHSLDAGYAVGVGVQDTNGLLLGVRYNGGLTDVYVSGYKARNSSFQFYIGYLFGSNTP